MLDHMLIVRWIGAWWEIFAIGSCEIYFEIFSCRWQFLELKFLNNSSKAYYRSTEFKFFQSAQGVTKTGCGGGGSNTMYWYFSFIKHFRFKSIPAYFWKFFVYWCDG